MGKGKTSDTKTPDISSGTMRIASSGSDSQERGEPVSTTTDTPQSRVASVGTQDLGQALRQLSQALTPEPDTSDLAEDPKEILKQLQLIEMQLMTLRQQLDEDMPLPLEPEANDKDAASLAVAGMQAREAREAAESAAAFPPPEVTSEGHVDGYA